jgi:nucleotidyltransferase substrate binding protein (TIGR01987 family)
MNIDTTYYGRFISVLEKAHGLLLKTNPETIDHDMYRSACVKEFEIIIEQSGKLLRKVLKSYFHSSQAVDNLNFKDIFRYAVKHGIMDDESGERWLQYRDNRNSTAHNYGVKFAEETLVLLPVFISDAKQLREVFKKHDNDSER